MICKDTIRHSSTRSATISRSEARLTCDDQGLIAGVGRVAILRSARCWTLRRSVATVCAILNNSVEFCMRSQAKQSR